MPRRISTIEDLLRRILYIDIKGGQKRIFTGWHGDSRVSNEITPELHNYLIAVLEKEG